VTESSRIFYVTTESCSFSAFPTFLLTFVIENCV